MGDIVTITKASTDPEEREELLAYVTRVDPAAETPIRVIEAPWGDIHVARRLHRCGSGALALSLASVSAIKRRLSWVIPRRTS